MVYKEMSEDDNTTYEPLSEAAIKHLNRYVDADRDYLKEDEYICPECKDFASPNAKSVNMHSTSQHEKRLDNGHLERLLNRESQKYRKTVDEAEEQREDFEAKNNSGGRESSEEEESEGIISRLLSALSLD